MRFLIDMLIFQRLTRNKNINSGSKPPTKRNEQGYLIKSIRVDRRYIKYLRREKFLNFQ